MTQVNQNCIEGTAFVATGNGKVELRKIHINQPGEWDLLLKLESSAVSMGTESYIIANMVKPEQPAITGYAPIARVEAVGEKAKEFFKPGDRVTYFAPELSLEGYPNYCGSCQSPALINVNPQSRDLLGPDRYCVKVPETLSSEKAAFSGIAAVSSMGATMPGTKPGDKVLVLGQGLIGQFAAQHFRLHGAEVAVSDINPERLAASTACGADHVINAAEQDTVEALRSIWKDGADIVADTTGSCRIIEATIGTLRKRGRYVFLGWCKGTEFELFKLQGQNAFEAFFPWTLEGAHVEHSLRMIDAGAIKVEPLITHRPDYTEAAEMYDTIINSPEKCLGVVFDWTTA